MITGLTISVNWSRPVFQVLRKMLFGHGDVRSSGLCRTDTFLVYMMQGNLKERERHNLPF